MKVSNKRLNSAMDDYAKSVAVPDCKDLLERLDDEVAQNAQPTRRRLPRRTVQLISGLAAVLVIAVSVPIIYNSAMNANKDASPSDGIGSSAPKPSSNKSEDGQTQFVPSAAQSEIYSSVADISDIMLKAGTGYAATSENGVSEQSSSLNGYTARLLTVPDAMADNPLSGLGVTGGNAESFYVDGLLYSYVVISFNSGQLAYYVKDASLVYFTYKGKQYLFSLTSADNTTVEVSVYKKYISENSVLEFVEQ